MLCVRGATETLRLHSAGTGRMFCHRGGGKRGGGGEGGGVKEFKLFFLQETPKRAR